MSLNNDKLTLNGIFIDPASGLELVPQAAVPTQATDPTHTIWLNSADDDHAYRGTVDLEDRGGVDIRINANVLELLDEDGVVLGSEDLSLYLDDTNLARIVSGTLDGVTGIATFTRDDATTFDVDMSALLSDLVFTGATAGAAGTQGDVPAPAAGDQEKYLAGDGTWKDLPSGTADTNYANNGLIADGDRTHTWAGFNKAETYTSGQDSKQFATGTVSLSQSTSASNGHESTLLNSANGDAAEFGFNLGRAWLQQTEGILNDTAFLNLQPLVGTTEAMLGYDDGDSTVGFRLRPDQVDVVTDNINNATATAGQVLTLVNPATGEVEYQDVAAAETLTTFARVEDNLVYTDENGAASNVALEWDWNEFESSDTTDGRTNSVWYKFDDISGTLTLNSSHTQGDVIWVSNGDTATANTLTVTDQGGDDIIDGNTAAASLVLNAGESAILVKSSTGGDWIVMSKVAVGGAVSSNITNADLTADANHTQDFAGFSQTWNNMGGLDVNSEGNISLDVSSAFLPGAAGSLSVGISSVIASGVSSTPNSIAGELRVDGNVARLQGSLSGKDVSFFIDNSGEAGTLGEAQAYIRTNAVDGGTATAGQVLTLLNAATGEVEYQDAAGSSQLHYVDIQGIAAGDVKAAATEIAGGAASGSTDPNVFGNLLNIAGNTTNTSAGTDVVVGGNNVTIQPGTYRVTVHATVIAPFTATTTQILQLTDGATVLAATAGSTQSGGSSVGEPAALGINRIITVASPTSLDLRMQNDSSAWRVKSLQWTVEKIG